MGVQQQGDKAGRLEGRQDLRHLCHSVSYGHPHQLMSQSYASCQSNGELSLKARCCSTMQTGGRLEQLLLFALHLNASLLHLFAS